MKIVSFFFFFLLKFLLKGVNQQKCIKHLPGNHSFRGFNFDQGFSILDSSGDIQAGQFFVEGIVLGFGVFSSIPDLYPLVSIPPFHELSLLKMSPDITIYISKVEKSKNNNDKNKNKKHPIENHGLKYMKQIVHHSVGCDKHFQILVV